MTPESNVEKAFIYRKGMVDSKPVTDPVVHKATQVESPTETAEVCLLLGKRFEILGKKWKVVKATRNKIVLMRRGKEADHAGESV